MLKAYGNKDSDKTFSPSGEFPVCIDDFGFLWFEGEYVIEVADRQLLVARSRTRWCSEISFGLLSEQRAQYQQRTPQGWPTLNFLSPITQSTAHS